MITCVKPETTRDTQPHKFILYVKHGQPIRGGAETKDLCIDHILHCLGDDIAHIQDKNRNFITVAYYLGYKGRGTPRKVTL